MDATAIVIVLLLAFTLIAAYLVTRGLGMRAAFAIDALRRRGPQGRTPEGPYFHVQRARPLGLVFLVIGILGLFLPALEGRHAEADRGALLRRLPGVRPRGPGG
jgi:hypothetical protein